MAILARSLVDVRGIRHLELGALTTHVAQGYEGK